MKHQCTPDTDLDELIGHDDGAGYQYGPLACAMRDGEELVLEESATLSWLTRIKLQALMGGLFIAETGESIHASPFFQMRFN